MPHPCVVTGILSEISSHNKKIKAPLGQERPVCTETERETNKHKADVQRQLTEAEHLHEELLTLLACSWRGGTPRGAFVSALNTRAPSEPVRG